jgi:hypothetical protein
VLVIVFKRTSAEACEETPAVKKARNANDNGPYLI